MMGRWATAANISALALLHHLQLNSTPLLSSPLSYSSAPPTQPVQSHGWDCWWMCVLQLFKTCSAQLFCDTVLDCSNQAQGGLAKAINLSSKFLERLSLVTEDHSCLVWFPPQRLGFPSSHSSLCVRDHMDLSVWLRVGGFLCVLFQITAHCFVFVYIYIYVCTKFTNQSLCFSNAKCSSCWHRLLLPIITPFIPPSSGRVSAVAPVLPSFSASISIPPHHYCLRQTWFQIDMFGNESFPMGEEAPWCFLF